jgi:hypothetical protein
MTKVYAFAPASAVFFEKTKKAFAVNLRYTRPLKVLSGPSIPCWDLNRSHYACKMFRD